jgi:hypothetical protein
MNCNVGSCAGTYHYHNGGYTPPSYTPPKRTSVRCPANSVYDSGTGKCSCNGGYTVSVNRSYCVKVPLNAYAVNSNSDTWMCNSGYKEVGNSCIKKITPTPSLKLSLSPRKGEVKGTNKSSGQTGNSFITWASIIAVTSYLLSKKSKK